MKMSELREFDPDLAAIIERIGPHITAGAIYDADGALIHGTPPTDPRGTVLVSPETYEKMRAYGASPANPKLPRSPR